MVKRILHVSTRDLITFQTDLFQSLVCKYAQRFLYQEAKISDNSEPVYSSLSFSLSSLLCHFKKTGPLEFCGKICGKFCCNFVPAESTFGCRIPENLEKRNPTLSETNTCWKGALVHLARYTLGTSQFFCNNCAQWTSLQSQKRCSSLVWKKEELFLL